MDTLVTSASGPNEPPQPGSAPAAAGVPGEAPRAGLARQLGRPTPRPELRAIGMGRLGAHCGGGGAGGVSGAAAPASCGAPGDGAPPAPQPHPQT